MAEQARGLAARFRARFKRPIHGQGGTSSGQGPMHPFRARRRRVPIEDKDVPAVKPMDPSKFSEFLEQGAVAEILMKEQLRKLDVLNPMLPIPLIFPLKSPGSAPGSIFGRGGGRGPEINPKLPKDFPSGINDILADLEVEIELAPAFADAEADVASEVRAAVRQSAFDLRDAMIEEFQLGEGPSAPGAAPAVVTGALLRSITVAFDSDGLGALVGPTAPYAIYLEFGTMNMPARPFLLPAFSRMEDQIVKQITVAGRRALRRRGVFIGV